MKTTIFTQGCKPLTIDYPQNYKSLANSLTERYHKIPLQLGKGDYKEFFFEGMHIGYGDIILKNNTTLHYQMDFPTVKMHFSLCGNSHTITGVDRKKISFGCNEHNLINTPNFKAISKLSNCPILKTFGVSFIPAYFEKYLPEVIKLFTEFGTYVKNKKLSILGKQNRHITSQMHFIINDIMNCKRVGPFKKIFLETKVIELLLLQLEQFYGPAAQSSSTLKKTDIEKVYMAKEIILKNIHHPCSLIDLARQVGTNDFTLKKGFKEIFGTTVFGYISDIKMEQARKILLQEAKTVSEVAELIGYKNATHFTAAFKKKFGIVPSSLRK